MRTVFVINEETGKVVGTMEVKDEDTKVLYVEMEELEGGVCTIAIEFELKEVPIGRSIALVIVAPDEEIARSLVEAEGYTD